MDSSCFRTSIRHPNEHSPYVVPELARVPPPDSKKAEVGQQNTFWGSVMAYIGGDQTDGVIEAGDLAKECCSWPPPLLSRAQTSSSPSSSRRWSKRTPFIRLWQHCLVCGGPWRAAFIFLLSNVISWKTWKVMIIAGRWIWETFFLFQPGSTMCECVYICVRMCRVMRVVIRNMDYALNGDGVCQSHERVHPEKKWGDKLWPVMIIHLSFCVEGFIMQTKPCLMCNLAFC